MTDLRKAAEMALEVLETTWGDGSEYALKEWKETIQALRQALEQSEWVGLTDEEIKSICNEWKIMYGGYVDNFAKFIEAKLKEKNT